MNILKYRNLKKFQRLIYILFIISTNLSRAKTEVIIIGSIHKPTKKYTSEVLAKILFQLKPHLILVELDSSYFDEDWNLKKLYGGLEETAVLDVKKQFDIKIRPFDIEGRVKFYIEKNFFELEKELFATLEELYTNKKLSSETAFLYGYISDFFKIRESFYSEMPLEVFNSISFDILNERGRYFVNESIKKIIDKTVSLKKFKDYWRSENDFWEKRNNVMAKNIQKYVHDFPDRRIVVIVGVEHRSYLKGLLSPEQNGYVLKEYWEILKSESSDTIFKSKQ